MRRNLPPVLFERKDPTSPSRRHKGADLWFLRVSHTCLEAETFSEKRIERLILRSLDRDDAPKNAEKLHRSIAHRTRTFHNYLEIDSFVVPRRMYHSLSVIRKQRFFFFCFSIFIRTFVHAREARERVYAREKKREEKGTLSWGDFFCPRIGVQYFWYQYLRILASTCLQTNVGYTRYIVSPWYLNVVNILARRVRDNNLRPADFFFYRRGERIDRA